MIFEARYKTENGGTRVGKLEVVPHWGQMHAFLTRKDRSTTQVAALTKGDWNNLPFRRMILRQAGITSVK